jgi:hypothetical protein
MKKSSFWLAVIFLITAIIWHQPVESKIYNTSTQNSNTRVKDYHARVTKDSSCTPNTVGIKGKYPQKLNFVNVTAYPFCVKANINPLNRKAVRLNTIAIQKAINETINRQFAIKTLYFPAGIYYFDDTLDLITKNYLGSARYESVLGDGSNKSIIKLIDNASGFNNSKKPKIFVKMAKFGGSNNVAHNNYIQDLGIHVGANNIGVIALNYISSNNGTIENVIIQSDDPQGRGAIGLGMLENWPGPSFVKNVTIKGFDYGVKLLGEQYGVFFQTLKLHDQRVVGFYDENYAVIRNLISSNRNPVPVFESANSSTQRSTIIDANVKYTGESKANTVAFKIRKGHIFVRNAKVQGYKQSLIKDNTVLTGNIVEYASMMTKLFADSSAKSMSLPIEEVPECTDCDNVKNWYIIQAKGFNKSAEELDYTEDMKRAFASGKPVIYIGQVPGLPSKSSSPNHKVGFSEPLIVPPHVKKIAFWFQWIVKTKNFPSGKPLFIVNGNKANAPLILEKPLNDFEIEHIGSRTLVVKNPSGSVYKALPGAGTVFFEDYGGTIILTKNQKAFGWSLNPEGKFFIQNNGAQLSIVGLKYEGDNTVIKTSNGGRTQLLGGFIYALGRATDHAIFESYNSEHSLIYNVINHGHPKVGYDWSVKEVRGNVTKTRNGIWDRNVLHTGYSNHTH